MGILYQKIWIQGDWSYSKVTFQNLIGFCKKKTEKTEIEQIVQGTHALRLADW